MCTVRSIVLTTSCLAIIGCQQEPEMPVPEEAGSEIAIVSKLTPNANHQIDVAETEQSSKVVDDGSNGSGQGLPTAVSPSAALPVVNESAAVDQPGRHGPRGGMGRGFKGGSEMRGDMTTIHAMFASRDKITRTVKTLPNGAQAVTESDDEAIAELIQEHVPAVESRVLENMPLPPMTFHPIFTELMKHSEDYSLAYDVTEKGMRVTYTATDPYVVMLVQEHAKLVSRFLKNGMTEIHKQYEFPPLNNSEPKTQN